MKIQKIASSGTVAVKQVEIDVKSPITLICGSNRAGKSSLRNGIYHAFIGENPCEPLKKNYGFLINRDGGNNVGYTYVDYNGGQRACITLPNGTHELSEQQHFALPYVLNPSLFASITPDERRRFLFDLGNLRSDGSEVKEKLLARKCDAAKIDTVMPFLRSSFDNAQKHAIEKTKEARTNWKATTGEVYGDKKAADWKAPIPAIDVDAKTKADDDLSDIDRTLEETNKKLGAMQAEINNARNRNAEIVRLRDTAEKIDRIRTKLDADRQQVAIWTVKVEDTRRLAQGSSPGNVACKCPECDAELVFNGKELVSRGGDLHGDEDSAVKLPEHEDTLKMLKNAVANGERDFVAATAAREQLALLVSENNAAPTPEDIEAMNNKIALLKASRKQAQETLDQVNKNIRLASEAEAKTKKAAEYHAEAQAWDSIAEALAPDGIPSEMLSAALDPINERISLSVKALEFPGKVCIQDDMTIMEDDGKLYSFSSKATRLLIDSMIAEAISYVLGIKMIMVDEFDLLDLPSRSAYLNWLINLARNKEIDSVLLFGTLKSQPSGLPTEVSAYWIEDGVIRNQEAKAA